MKERSLFLLYHLLVVLLLLLAACAGAEPVLLTPTSQLPTQSPIPSNTPRPSETPRPSDTPMPTITPEGEIGSKWVRAKDGMVMLYVPKGAFSMGSITGEPDEKPVRLWSWMLFGSTRMS